MHSFRDLFLAWCTVLVRVEADAKLFAGDRDVGRLSTCIDCQRGPVNHVAGYRQDEERLRAAGFNKHKNCTRQ